MNEFKQLVIDKQNELSPNLNRFITKYNIDNYKNIDMGGGGILRGDVHNFEELTKQAPQIDLPVKHYFSNGLYARELFIPKGIILTGKIHKYENIFILSKGDMSILIDGEMIRIQASYTIIAPPGTKRIIYAHENCICTTFHVTNEIDLEVIEEHFIAKNEQEYLEFINKEEQLQLPLDS